MVFASIRKHASNAIFLRAPAGYKKICFASSEQFREYNSGVASTSYIFRLQQIFNCSENFTFAPFARKI